MARADPVALFLAAVVVVVGMLGAVSSLEVTSPSSELVAVAERTYTVEWTGTEPGGRYYVDLYRCGPNCVEDDDCGDWVVDLCHAEYGCLDDEGGTFDAVMPQPTGGPGGYKVRVMNAVDEAVAGCSSEFSLVAPDKALSGRRPGKSYLKVTSPAKGDLALSGEEYTVEFDFQQNGGGSKANRFSIDLYKAGRGSGDCGTYVTSVCDKAQDGCKDSKGDYDVIIPEDTLPGNYKIRVGLFGDDKLFGCSGGFKVVRGPDWTEGSISFSHSYEF